MLFCFGSYKYKNLKRPVPILLLSYLHLEGKKSREDLIHLFWPAIDRKIALGRLSETLRKLRSEGISIEGNVLEVTVDSDINCLLNALKSSDFSEALGIYKGPFLAEIEKKAYFPKSDSLTSWLITKRENFKQQYLDTLLNSAEYSATKRDFSYAAKVAWQAFELDSDITEHHYDDLQRIYRLLVAEPNVERSSIVKNKALEQFEGLQLVDSIQKARSELLGQYGLPNLNLFIGRRKELKTLEHLIDDNQIVLIKGLAGVGKTSLALALIHNLDKREICFINKNQSFLETMSDYCNFSALDVSLANIASKLFSKDMLIVIDDIDFKVDFNHVKRLCQQCPQLRIIMTSQQGNESPNIYGFQIEGLSTAGDLNSEAVELFQSLCKAKGIKLSQEDKRYLPTLTYLIGGHPLGLELAVSWMTSSNLDALCTMLEESHNSLDFILGSQQNISGLFEAVLSKLPTSLDFKFKQLALFEGAFTFENANALVDLTEMDIHLLVKHSLLTAQSDAKTYTIQPMLRNYCSKGLSKTSIISYATVYLTALVDMTTKGIFNTINASDVFKSWEYAISHHLHEVLLGSSVSFGRFCDELAWQTKGVELLVKAKQSYQADEYLYKLLSSVEVFLRYRLGDYAYITEIAQSIDLSGLPISDKSRFFSAAAAAYDNLGEFKEAQRLLVENISLFVDDVDKQKVANAKMNLANAYIQTGDYVLASNLLNEAQRTFDFYNNSIKLAWLDRTRGLIRLETGLSKLAIHYFEKVLVESKKLKLNRLTYLATDGIALAYLRDAINLRGASVFIRDFVDETENTKDLGIKIKALRLMGLLLFYEGNPHKSLQFLLSAFTYSQQLGSIPTQLFILTLTARTLTLLVEQSKFAGKLLGFLKSPIHFAKMSFVDQGLLDQIISENKESYCESWQHLNIKDISILIESELLSL